MIVKLDSKDFDKILDSCENVADFIIEIHKKIVSPKIFDAMEKLGDFVYCNETTANNIGKKVLNQYGLNSLMTWMNYGFSTYKSDHLNDFEFDITSILTIHKNQVSHEVELTK